VLTNNRQLVNLLIKNYADVLIKDLHDQTPMHLLCMKSQGSTGNLEIFKILLNSCYDAKDSLDVKKKSPMDYAKESGFEHLIEYAKTVTDVLFSRDYQKVMSRASGAVTKADMRFSAG
jgi:hypothetical protein